MHRYTGSPISITGLGPALSLAPGDLVDLDQVIEPRVGGPLVLRDLLSMEQLAACEPVVEAALVDAPAAEPALESDPVSPRAKARR